MSDAGRSTGNGETQPTSEAEVSDARDRTAQLGQHTARAGEPSGTTRPGGASELDDPDATADPGIDPDA